MTRQGSRQLMHHSVIPFVFIHVPFNSPLFLFQVLSGYIWAGRTFCQGLPLMLGDTRVNRSCTIGSSVSLVSPALRYEQR